MYLKIGWKAKKTFGLEPLEARDAAISNSNIDKDFNEVFENPYFKRF